MVMDGIDIGSITIKIALMDGDCEAGPGLFFGNNTPAPSG